jgi:hypothetical protein
MICATHCSVRKLHHCTSVPPTVSGNEPTALCVDVVLCHLRARNTLTFLFSTKGSTPCVHVQTASWSIALQWFILSLQLLLIILIPVVSAMGLLRRMRASLIGLLAVVTAIWLYTADTVRDTWCNDGGPKFVKYRKVTTLGLTPAKC